MQISQSGRELFQFKIGREWEGHGATCPFTHDQAWNQRVIFYKQLAAQVVKFTHDQAWNQRVIFGKQFAAQVVKCTKTKHGTRGLFLVNN